METQDNQRHLLISIKSVLCEEVKSQWRLKLLQTHFLCHIVHQCIGMVAVLVCLSSSDEYKVCITWTTFQMGQICITTLCCSVCMCVCVCVWERVCGSGRTWQGMRCRQLKLLINALLDNIQANPIIWQAAIRAFASLTACLSVSLLGADMLSVACYKGEQRESHELSLILWFSLGQEDNKGIPGEGKVYSVF